MRVVNERRLWCAGMSPLHVAYVGAIVIGLVGCGIDMEQHYQGMRAKLVMQDYDGADRYLDAAKEDVYGQKNRLLYYMNKGMVLHLAGKYGESNGYLEQAKQAADALWTESVGSHAAAWLTTDNALPYQGEDFEKVLIHYIAALNYLALHDNSAAQVEARQVSQKLDMYNAKYGETKNAYRDDAFCRWLSGKLTESETDDGSETALNEAWIDYKKALALYQKDYLPRYGTPTPQFVVADALRVVDALKSDFSDDWKALRKQFPDAAFLPEAQAKTQGEIILVHLNGEAPYKQDRFWTAVAGPDVIRIAYPEFVPKYHRITSARMSVVGRTDQPTVTSELGEDITAIAVQNLQDHMSRIKAKAIARQVSKFIAAKAMQVGGQSIASKKGSSEGEEVAGAVLQIAGLLTEWGSAITEEADKRSWITLPATVNIGRMYVAPGDVALAVDFLDKSGAVVETANLATHVKAGETVFLMHRTYR